MSELPSGLPDQYYLDFNGSINPTKKRPITTVVTVLGDSAVGKTTGITRLTDGLLGQSIVPQSTIVDENNFLESYNSIVIQSEIPHNDYRGIPLISNTSLNRMKESIRDLAGQQNYITRVGKKINPNLPLIIGTNAFVFTADLTRPNTIASLIDNWIPMTEFNRGTNCSILVDFNKAGLAGILDDVAVGSYDSLTSMPRVNELLSTLETAFGRKPIVAVTDYDVIMDNTPHQVASYIIKAINNEGTYGWLDFPVMTNEKILAIPVLEYGLRNNRFSEGTVNLIDQFSASNGITFRGY